MLLFLADIDDGDMFCVTGVKIFLFLYGTYIGALNIGKMQKSLTLKDGL